MPPLPLAQTIHTRHHHHALLKKADGRGTAGKQTARQRGVIPGACSTTHSFDVPAALVLLCELRPGFAEKFKTAKHFGSWLGLCPDNRITGGRIYSVKTRDVKSRVATALRLAARSLYRAQNYFGDLYRRWRARLGGPKAVTAMAHKLARVLWHLLKFKQPFDWKVFAREEQKMKTKKLARLQTMAASLNYQLVPNL